MRDHLDAVDPADSRDELLPRDEDAGRQTLHDGVQLVVGESEVHRSKRQPGSRGRKQRDRQRLVVDVDEPDVAHREGAKPGGSAARLDE